MEEYGNTKHWNNNTNPDSTIQQNNNKQTQNIVQQNRTQYYKIETYTTALDIVQHNIT